MKKIRAEFIISGHVQGVGFRYFVYRKAEQIGLEGYARNLYDGTVEVKAEGGENLIAALKQYLEQGPSRSRVDSCKVIFSDATGEFNGFGIR